MARPPYDRPVEQRDEAVLRALAEQLRDVAVRAGRPDVAARAQEALTLLGPVQEEQRKDAANVVVRILDGLGF
jgi:regulator of sirC expression with transglutaminase-like and TPR domain